MPSSRPTKPSCSLVVALTETRSAEIASISASAATIAARCGPILGASADQGHVDIGDAAAARAHQPRRMLDEEAGGGAPPLRIGGREMRADIAGAAGGEQRVGQGMQRDIGVGMSGQSLVVRDRDAAQRHMVARLEGMDVVAVAGAHVGKAAPPTDESRWSAMAISLAQVSFTLSGEPATILHRRAWPIRRSPHRR